MIPTHQAIANMSSSSVEDLDVDDGLAMYEDVEE